MEIKIGDQCAKPIVGCSRIKNIILDMHGVLLQSNLEITYGTAVSPEMFKRILRSNVWFKYQTGNISADEAFAQLSVKMGCSAEDLREFCQNARSALVTIKEIVQLLETVDLNLYCMTNCPAEDAQEILKAFPDIFGRFKKIYTSADCGMRKPNLNFFKHVMHETGVTPLETIFLDDDLANITTAESLGIISILVPSPHNAPAMAETVKQIISTLRTTEEQLSAAKEYMLDQRGVYKSLALTREGLRVPVTFFPFIIAGLLGDSIYLPAEGPPERGTINFFAEGDGNGHPDDTKALLTAINLPDDADTTSIGLAAYHRFSKASLPLIYTVLDKMEKDLISEDGLFQVYFDPLRPRVEPVSLTNTLYLFHLAGRGGMVTKASEDFLLNLLRYRRTEGVLSTT